MPCNFTFTTHMTIDCILHLSHEDFHLQTKMFISDSSTYIILAIIQF